MAIAKSTFGKLMEIWKATEISLKQKLRLYQALLLMSNTSFSLQLIYSLRVRADIGDRGSRESRGMAAAVAMAFQFELVPAVEVSAALRAAFPSSERIVRLADDRFPAMTKWLPWAKHDFGIGLVWVLGADFFAFLFNDEIGLPLDVLPDSPPVGWSQIRLTIEAFTTIMVAASGAGMVVKVYESHLDFLLALREALGRLPRWPCATAAQLEFEGPIDFATPQTAPFKYLQFMEKLSLQDLRTNDTLRTEGWGVLAFSLAPCWSVADKYGEDQAYVSVGGRWCSQVLAQLGGTSTAVRLSVMADTARQVLVQLCQVSRFLVVREGSVEREREFVTLMELGGGSAERMAAAFQSKLPTIIARFDRAEPIRRLMGRTSDVSLVVEWCSQLGATLCPGKEVSSMAGLKRLAIAVAPRLGFLDLEEWKVKSDEQWVEHVISSKGSGRLVGAAVVGADSEDKQDGELELQGLSRPVLAARLERLHLLTRFQKAVLEIAAVVKKPGVTVMELREVTFKQAIGALNRHLLGKELLTGLQVYDDLLSARCKAGPGGNVGAIMGKFMGQQMVKGKAGMGGFTLEGSAFVDAFLSGKLDSVNVESEVLNRLTSFESGGVMQGEKVVFEDRYLDYILVDRMIEEVAPIFEAFGLGSSSDAFTWASVMAEVKAQIKAVNGLAKCDQDDLLRSPSFGMQAYVEKALKAANNTLIKLFQEKDPLALAEPGRLLPSDDLQFNDDLAQSRLAIKARRTEQNQFP